MLPPSLESTLSPIPPGPYALAASAGADSTALLRLAHATRPDLRLHVLHLNHQTRGDESAADANFISHLATQLNLPHTIALCSDFEPYVPDLPTNPSARYRALRLAFFRQACEQHNLLGVLLAHHAADQAETVLQRLLRNSTPPGLTGMRPDTKVRGVRLLRPLLNTHPDDLRAYLRALNQRWREDASNTSPAYQRNRVRSLLSRHRDLTESLLTLSQSCADLTEWSRAAAPALADAFATTALAALPDILAHESARAWVARHGAPKNELTPAVLSRLVTFARDAAAPPREHFPGKLLVRRRAGKIWIDR